ncbi:hypothetical protein ACHAWF_014090 [Thalassiosira exigua]
MTSLSERGDDATPARNGVVLGDDGLLDPEAGALTRRVDETGAVAVSMGASAVVVNEVKPGREPLPPVISRMPNTAFGIPMGLAGHAIMWKTLRDAQFVNQKSPHETMVILNIAAWYLSVSVAAFLLACYMYKVLTSFALAKAEYLNETRCHFFNAPNLVYMMLLIGLPEHLETSGYTAKPQSLMSTVGWFFLAILGQSCNIRAEWGIGLPQMCFGAGFMLYIDITIFIFGKLHENKGMKGSAAMFLLIAPPSVGVVSLDMLNDGASDFSTVGEMLLGWVLVLLLLLCRLGPILWRQPSVLGEYWAYVFPISAAATATIRYASALNSKSTEVLALIMIIMAIVSFLLVLVRMTFHIYRCVRKQGQYGDPLFQKDKYRTGRSLSCFQEQLL